MPTVNYHYLTLFLAALGIYLLWMDVGLYLEVQKFTARVPGIPGNTSSPSPYTFSPFCPITVKLLMLPSTIQYVDEPLAYMTVRESRIADYISPNAMSLMGVGVAMVSARFLAHPDTRYRVLGVLLFKVRDYIDGLDGSIARERSHSHSIGHVANPSSSGWMVDGICDGFADVLRFLAFIVVVQRALGGGKGAGGGYTLLGVELGAGTGCLGHLSAESGRVRGWLGCLHRFWVTHQRAVLLVACVGFQSLFSSIMWNYFMINYHHVLETDQYLGPTVDSLAVARAQAGILRSSSMWMVCYFWRLVNPQSMTQIQLLAVLYNREVDLILAVGLIGYLPPALVGLGSYLHLQLADEAIRAVAHVV